MSIWLPLSLFPRTPPAPLPGIRTPLPVAEMASVFPEAHADLVENAARLERHMRDMQVRGGW